MKKFAILALAVVFAACDVPDPVTPLEDLEAPVALSTTTADACWGQATAVFARLGMMGAHASQQANPRFGLANLARALYEAGVIPEPTLQALAAFKLAELGLSIDACM